MVSSANLTFGGWAKNRECFSCDKIENTFVARNIGVFFEGITSQLKGLKEHELLSKLNRGIFGQNGSKSYFFSSFSNRNFLDQLNNTNPPCSLRVWSPYFADDLNAV